MRTKEVIRARLKALTPNDAIPPFTAKEVILYEIIDQMKQAMQARLTEDCA